MSNEKKKNAIIYCRVSTTKQSKNGDSPAEQERACRVYCERMGYTVLAVFKDTFTGTKTERPEVQKAVDFIETTELNVDFLVALNIDRITRGGIYELQVFKDKFERLGVQVQDSQGIIQEGTSIIEIEGINMDKYAWNKSNSSKYAESITAMVGEEERYKILQRTTGQSIRLNNQGYKVRNSDYGFKNYKEGKRTIQIENPEESIFIKKIYELRARGDLSDKEIVQILNDMGYASRKRNKWDSKKESIIGIIGGKKLNPEQLQRYISSPVYAGVIKEEWTGYRAIKTPYSGIISIELWNKANRGKYKIIENTDGTIEISEGEKDIHYPRISQTPKNYNPEYPYGKSLKCPECGGHLTAEKARSKNGTYHHYYQCRGKKGVKHKNYSLRRDETNTKMEEMFSSIKFDNNLLDLFGYISNKVYEERETELNENIKVFQNRLEEVRVREQGLLGSISQVSKYPDFLEKLNEEYIGVKEERKSLEVRISKQSISLSLDRFQKYSKKALSNIHILASRREKPDHIMLAFELVFGERVTFEEIKSRTLITEELLALNTQKKPGLQCNVSQADVLNRKWWVIRGSNPGPSP